MGGSGGGSTKQQSTLDPAQRKLLQKASEFILPRIGQGATPLEGEVAAGIPGVVGEAFGQFEQSLGQDTAFIREILSGVASGEGTFQANIPEVSKTFRKQVLDPVTQALNQTLGQDTRNQQNVPGRFFGSDVEANVSGAIANQLGITTAPLLAGAIEAERGREFSSQEAARARQPGAAAALQQLPGAELGQALQGAAGYQGFEQTRLNLVNQEFLRLQEENDPFLRLAMGFSTTPTMENIVQQGSDMSGLGAGIGLLAGAALAAPTGGMSLAMGASLGGAAGGAIGSSF